MKADSNEFGIEENQMHLYDLAFCTGTLAEVTGLRLEGDYSATVEFTWRPEINKDLIKVLREPPEDDGCRTTEQGLRLCPLPAWGPVLPNQVGYSKSFTPLTTEDVLARDGFECSSEAEFAKYDDGWRMTSAPVLGIEDASNASATQPMASFWNCGPP